MGASATPSSAAAEGTAENVENDIDDGDDDLRRTRPISIFGCHTRVYVRLTVTMTEMMVMITAAIAEMMALIPPPMAETTEPCKLL